MIKIILLALTIIAVYAITYIINYTIFRITAKRLIKQYLNDCDYEFTLEELEKLEERD